MGFKPFHDRAGARKPKRSNKERMVAAPRSEPKRPWHYYSLMLPRGFRGIRN